MVCPFEQATGRNFNSIDVSKSNWDSIHCRMLIAESAPIIFVTEAEKVIFDE